MSYELRQGQGACGFVFFVIEVDCLKYTWEVIDDKGWWATWPTNWKLLPTHKSSKLAFLIHEGKELEETMREHPALRRLL